MLHDQKQCLNKNIIFGACISLSDTYTNYLHKELKTSFDERIIFIYSKSSRPVQDFILRIFHYEATIGGFGHILYNPAKLRDVSMQLTNILANYFYPRNWYNVTIFTFTPFVKCWVMSCRIWFVLFII